MQIMTELADVQNIENGTVAPAEIPSENLTPAEASEPKTEKPLSLREQINKSVETIRTEEAKRARDVATGKFTKDPEKTEDAPQKAAPAEIPTAPEAKAEVPPPSAPPSAWTKIWDSLPPEARDIAVKRETEVEKGFAEYRNKTAQLQEISQVLEPLKPVFQQNGLNETQAIKRLIEWEGNFRNPATRMQAFHNLAQQYGVDLNSLVQNPIPADIPEPLRPVIDQFGNIAHEVTTLKQEFQRSREAQVNAELTAFAKDKPHFDKVRTLMGQLMNSGVATDLESAYQKATLLHPEVSAQIEAEKTAKAQAELAKTNAEKAQRARQAAVSPSNRSPNGPVSSERPRPKSSSVRDSLMNSVAELRDRT
jgi:predicted Holliday junction resolvase-like endonuclease